MSLCTDEANSFGERTRSQGGRALWSAVVLQAKSDIETEPMDSVDYAQAVAFFTGGGEWAHGRANVADFLDLHPDDLERCGRRWIAARRRQEGLSPEPERPLRSVPLTGLRTPLNLTGLVAIPAPPQRRRCPATQEPKCANPFNPFRVHANQA